MTVIFLSVVCYEAATLLSIFLISFDIFNKLNDFYHIFSKNCKSFHSFIFSAVEFTNTKNFGSSVKSHQ